MNLEHFAVKQQRITQLPFTISDKPGKAFSVLNPNSKQAETITRVQVLQKITFEEAMGKGNRRGMSSDTWLMGIDDCFLVFFQLSCHIICKSNLAIVMRCKGEEG